MGRHGFGFGSGLQNSWTLGQARTVSRNFTTFKEGDSQSGVLDSTVTLSEDFEIPVDFLTTSTGFRYLTFSDDGGPFNYIRLDLTNGNIDISIDGSFHSGTNVVTLNDGRFHTVKLVRTGTTATTFFDDVLVDTFLGVSTNDFKVSAFGARLVALTAFFDGVIANPKIYDAGVLIHSWLMDEEDPSSMTDRVGSNDMTGTNLSTADSEPFTFSRLFNAWLAVELMTNGNFAIDSDWTKGTGWTISGGQALYDGTGGSSQFFQDSISLIDGFIYLTTIDTDSNTGTGTNPVDIGTTRFLDIHLLDGLTSAIDVSGSGVRWSVFGRASEPLVFNKITLFPRIKY